MTRQVNQQTFDLIKKWESYQTALPNGDCMAYLDTVANRGSWSPGYDGLWTIGWGSTGPYITKGTVWTRLRAEAALRDEVNEKAAEIEAYLTNKNLNDNQFGALVSLAYNVGTAGIHGILTLVNEGKLAQAGAAFPEYDHSDGVVIQGLLNRRLDEQELFEWEVPAQIATLSPDLAAANSAKTVTAVTAATGTVGFLASPQVQTLAASHVGWIMLGFAAVIFIIFELGGQRILSNFNLGYFTPPGTTPPPARAMVAPVTNATTGA